MDRLDCVGTSRVFPDQQRCRDSDMASLGEGLCGVSDLSCDIERRDTVGGDECEARGRARKEVLRRCRQPGGGISDG